MTIDLHGRVALVTGAGVGLGRSHALLLAQRGAKVVVNDIGEPEAPGASALAVVQEIRAMGGEAMASAASVTDYLQVQSMVDRVLDQWGRVDILVNNAGILRDKTFAKMSLEDFRIVIEVHLFGAVNCTKALWEGMRMRNYGRIVMTTSSSGLYGNFGQANYGAAKMALVGLMRTLALEGAKNDIRVNCLAPTAATGMVEGLLPSEMIALLGPEHVSPGLLALVAENAPNQTILCGGAGSFEHAHVTLTRGVHIGGGPCAAEQIQMRWDEIGERTAEKIPASGREQAELELANAGFVARN